MTKFQLTDLEGNVLEETEVVLGEKDVLLLEKSDDMSIAYAGEWFNNITKALSRKADIIVYPEGFTFKVLKKQ